MDVIVNDRLESLPEGSIQVPGYGDFYYHLLSCLGYSSNHFPLADLLRRCHGLEGDWYIASLIHWQATHNDAMITASPDDLKLSELEARLWFAALKEFIAAENMELFYSNPHLWLIQCKQPRTIQAKPLYDVLNQSMMTHIRNLDSTLHWQRFITECQMFLGSHSLNDNRPDLPINGLWVWGGGALAKPGTRPIISGDSGYSYLASFLSTKVIPYEPRRSYPDNAVLLFATLAVKDLANLQNQLKHYTVNWHWNNLSYTTKPRKWWSRLWSK
ncbi:hypothetical protein [Legionella londiniensis]|uniref:Cofactor-independent phosphoglycerate mutase n=1 Tax=Legionella londiniensis TaxID=45068 RepID=A0A0W0VMJ4_9GAMM|nr:hypothetical protein [Legionella londiniensis]KTD21117.1 cofactor-independent phosphoglycerate mutase [Legionella londiniensis]STX93140.1 cofactor-independent phosphoglycerate mutase [Legionella londiniensis]